MKIPSENSAEARSAGPWLLLGFLALAFGSLGWLLAGGMPAPDVAGGGLEPWPYRLLITGWGASLLFAAGYHFGPGLAGGGLWSPASGWLHLALHGFGLGRMGHGYALGDGVAVATGAVLVGCGALMFVLNVLASAPSRGRLEPEFCLGAVALVWMAVDLLITCQIALDPRLVETSGSLRWKSALVGQAAVAGFLWQATMAFALEIARRYLVAETRATWMVWLGFALLNLGLLSFFVDVSAGSGMGNLRAALVAGGMFALLVALVARARDAAENTLAINGLLLGTGTSAILLAMVWPAASPTGSAIIASVIVLGIAWGPLAAIVVGGVGSGNGLPTGEGVDAERVPSLVFIATLAFAILGVGWLGSSGNLARAGGVFALGTLVWWCFALAPSWKQLLGGTAGGRPPGS